MRTTMCRFVVTTLLALIVASPAAAQLTAAKDGPIVYGHHHLSVTNVDEHKRFWIETLGGRPTKIGTGGTEIVAFSNVFIFFRQQAPSGGTKGTTVNHIGFWVPDIRQMVARVKAAGYAMATRAEVAPPQEVKDDLAFIDHQNTYIAYVMAPDDVKVELVENKALKAPIALHHIHYNTPQVAEMKAWYAKVFGAKPGMRGAFEAADLPGVNLTFSPAGAPVVGTRSRSLDHVGFEVKDLEAFCKALEGMGIKLDRPYTKLPALNLAIAFFTDPWGTYIELTEGLAAIP